MTQAQRTRTVELPEPALDGATALERALAERRSVRDYGAQPLTLAEVAQLLWAAQGVTAPDGGRTAPSAGALYPLEVHVVAGQVEGLPPGVYRYRPRGHRLVEVRAGDVRPELCAAALGQECVAEAPAVLAVAGVIERTRAKYGARAERYVHIEVGHACQNLYLQAVSLGLGTVMVGAFEDARVGRVLGLGEGERALALMPVGRRR